MEPCQGLIQQLLERFQGCKIWRHAEVLSLTVVIYPPTRNLCRTCDLESSGPCTLDKRLILDCMGS